MENEPEMSTLLAPYTDKSSENYKVMCDKVACLLTDNK